MSSDPSRQKALEVLARRVPLPVLKRAHSLALEFEREAQVRRYIAARWHWVALASVACVLASAGLVYGVFLLLDNIAMSNEALSLTERLLVLGAWLVVAGAMHVYLFAWLTARAHREMENL